MQYFRPGGPHFVGDCMPFSHDGVFHLFYLLDENHHQGRGGLGGHQWAHASSTDLLHWQQHPLALAIEHDSEASICTGSVFFDHGTFHAFFATRQPDFSQHLGHAVSTDCVHFQKLEPNPFASAPPGCKRNDLRDPIVVKEAEGRYSLLATSWLDPFPLQDRGGCLLRYTSAELHDWRLAGPFITPMVGRGYDSVPECPDLFEWNGRFYLLFGSGLQTHYRTAPHWTGPWTRPAIDTLDNHMNAVIKSAAFGGTGKGERRIGVGWLGSRKDNNDHGDRLWGGRTVFRELVQNADGSLGTAFVQEMLPVGGTVRLAAPTSLTDGIKADAAAVALDAPVGRAVAAFDGLPTTYLLRCDVVLQPGTAAAGVVVRGSGALDKGYEVRVTPSQRVLSLNDEAVPIAEEISLADGSTRHRLEVVVRADLVDVCLSGRHCVIDRCTELHGARLFLFCQDGGARFEHVQVQTLDWPSSDSQD